MELLESYRRDISRYPLLSHEELLESFRKFSEGDKSAKEKIYTSNLRLVISVINKYYPRVKEMENFMDLIQEGNLGLQRAIETFDIERKCRFSTCAVPWIRAYVRKAIQTLEKHSKNTERLYSSNSFDETNLTIKDEKIQNPEQEAIELGVSPMSFNYSII